PPAELVPLLEEIAAAVRPESLRTQLRAVAEADQRDLLPRIAVPTLLIWGELDARSPLSVARQFEQPSPRTARTCHPGRARVLPSLAGVTGNQGGSYREARGRGARARRGQERRSGRRFAAVAVRAGPGCGGRRDGCRAGALGIGQ